MKKQDEQVVIANALILAQGRFRKGSVRISGRRIASCSFSGGHVPSGGARVIDARGSMLLPGLIDLHFHGMDDIDTSRADAARMERLEQRLLKQGVTGFLPSLYSIPFPLMKRQLDFFRDYLKAGRGKSIVLGVNLEGPFLNRDQSGAHDKRLLVGFSDRKYLDLISSFRDVIRVITVSPELPGALGAIRHLSKLGIRVMIGHTLATFAQSEAAVAAGASGIAHFYNRITPFHHRDVGVMGTAFFNDRVYVELIADGLHSSREALKLAFRNIKRERVILVSDRVAHPSGGNILRGTQGCRGYLDTRRKFLGGGSSLLSCVRFTTESAGMALADAWAFASRNAAAYLGMAGSAGLIRKGMKADMVLMDRKWNIRTVFNSGAESCAE